MTKRQRLILDFDGTITNSIKSICKIYNDDFQYYKDFQPIKWCDINTWSFDELTLATDDYINQLWNQPRFFKLLEFMDNAEELLPIISEQYDIEIATLGHSPNCHGKEIWIQEHMPYVTKIHLINMHAYKDKSHIEMSDAILIDDSSTNLITSNAKDKILFGDTYPWNQNWKGKHYYNWYEVMEKLMFK